MKELEQQKIHVLELLESLDEIGKNDIHHKELEKELWDELDAIMDKIFALHNVYDY